MRPSQAFGAVVRQESQLTRRSVLIAILMSLGLSTPVTADNIQVVRAVDLSQHLVAPGAIVRVPDGGYVVAGSSGIGNTYGWAVRINSEGKSLWEYLDGPSDGWEDRTPNVNRFNGAVPLPDNRTLLCGTKHIKGDRSKNIAGRVVVLDGNGQVSEARDVFPNGDSVNYHTSIEACLRWGDGIALVASARGPTLSGLLVKLDPAGKKIWEKPVPFLNAFDTLETPNHELLVLSWVYEAQGTYARLDKVDPEGNVLITSQVPGGEHGRFVRSLPSASDIAMITRDGEGATSVVRVDSMLKQVSKPVSIGRFSCKASYSMADGSITLFGSVFDRGDTAAVGRLSRSFSLQEYRLQPLHTSFGITDATPSGHVGEFATVRTTGYRAELAWISLGR